MKRIRMKVSMAGPDEAWQLGDERDVADDVAVEWECLGMAEVIGDAEEHAEEKPKKPKGKK